MRHAPAKLSSTFTGLHEVISQKIELYITSAKKTSVNTQLIKFKKQLVSCVSPFVAQNTIPKVSTFHLREPVHTCNLLGEEINSKYLNFFMSIEMTFHDF
jgi:hypothetical protein